MRGKLQSRPINEVLAEAKRLAAAGVKELIVISQDTSAYGVDLKYAAFPYGDQTYKTQFYDLAKALSTLGIWVRLHYVYPYPHVDQVIPLMQERHLLPYLDIPFQHASPKILKLMKRPGNIENVLQRINQWRQICPNLTIRSTFIVGFPGETETDFQMLLDFLKQAQLERVGCFQYSAVDGARANDLPDAVRGDIKQERYDRFMQTQAAISTVCLAKKVGTTQQVIIDRITKQGIAIARSSVDAPDIDGHVVIKKPHSTLKVGDIALVKITGSDTYDLSAEQV